VTPIALVAEQVDSCYDPNHAHSLSWLNEYDSGNMDGACDNTVSYAAGCDPHPLHPQYTYADNSGKLIDPYFHIAENYGYGNYMFQTNQGPSFPAHRFFFPGLRRRFPTTMQAENGRGSTRRIPTTPTEQTATMGALLKPTPLLN
jgi:hypothetical protein